MILRPLEAPLPATQEFLPAWEVVERLQSQSYERCWMVTQPSHAALSGELASALRAPQFPVPDEQIVRAIALHDAGWGVPDAQAIVQSRGSQRIPPKSFIATQASQFLEAWEKSIATGESVSPAGGYIVSRHFWRLAEHRAKLEKNKSDRQKLESFLTNEDRRQKKLAARQSLNLQQLEDLTDLLQFCDLLSLYLCCGSRQNVAFPAYFGLEVRVENQDESYKFDPPMMESGATFALAALRYPAAETSSREIEIRVL